MERVRLYERIEEASIAEVADLAKRDPESAAWVLTALAEDNEAALTAGSKLTFEVPRRDRASLAREQRDLATTLRRIVEERDAA